MKKYELTAECKTLDNGTKLFRIKSLRDFSNVKAGDLGGWVEKEGNLSQEGDAWVYDYAIVCEKARVFGNARVSGDAMIFGDAMVFGNAVVSEKARVFGDAWVFGNATVFKKAKVYGNANVQGYARIFGDAMVFGDAWISGDANIHGEAMVFGIAWISGDAVISGNAEVCLNNHYATIKGFGTYFRKTTFFRCKDEKIRVNCGCFHGTIDEFRERVKNTREGKIAKEYLMIADLMEYHFSDAE